MRKRLCALFLVLVLVLSAAAASAAYYRVNTTWLKVHQLPEFSSKVLDSYRRDWAMTVDKRYDDWAYVTFTNGKDGYVQSKYLKSTKSYSAWINSDGVALRRGPDYTFSTTGTLNKGAKVTVLSHGSKYDYVTSGVGRGYVRSSALSKKKVKSSGKASTSSTIAGEGETYDAYVVNPNNRTVNLRKGPGKEYGVLNEFRPGTGVSVLEAGETWSKVSIYGLTGYMMSEFLSKEKPASASEEKPKPAGGAETAEPVQGPPYACVVTSPNGKSVNVHRGPGLGYANAMDRLAVGTEVTLLEWTNRTWSKIEVNGKTGYIMTKYLNRK